MQEINGSTKITWKIIALAALGLFVPLLIYVYNGDMTAQAAKDKSQDEQIATIVEILTKNQEILGRIDERTQWLKPKSLQ